MRIFVLLLTLVASVPVLYGCTTADPNSRVYQTMNNPPNACGPGLTRDRNAC